MFRLLVPFALGAAVTFLITSINYRREHLRDMRAVYLRAVEDVAGTAVELWCQEEFDRSKLARLRGALTFLDHLLEYTLSGFSAEERKRVNELHANLAEAALGRDEIDSNKFHSDLRRATEVQTIAAMMMAKYSEISMRRMSLLRLVVESFREAARPICNLIKNAANSFKREK